MGYQLGYGTIVINGLASGSIIPGGISGDTVFQASGVYMTSATTVAVVSGMGLAGTGDLNSGCILNGCMSGDTTFQVSGSYLNTGWAQASGIYMNSGDDVGKWVTSGYAQASGEYVVPGDLLAYQVSGAYMASGIMLTSGNVVSIVSGMGLGAGLGDLTSGSIINGGMSGDTVFQLSGDYVSTGWAQASGVFMNSGDDTGKWMASGVNLTSGNVVGIVSGMGLLTVNDYASGSIAAAALSGATFWQSSGEFVVPGDLLAYQVSGCYQASGVYMNSGVNLTSANVISIVSGMDLGTLVSGTTVYGELWAANLGDGLVYNYLSGVASNVELDTTSGRITVLAEGDYYVGFEAQMTATSGGSATALKIKKNNTTISGATQNIISPGMVANYSYCEGTTQTCLVHAVSGDYFTAWQEETTGDWTMTAGKIYLFKYGVVSSAGGMTSGQIITLVSGMLLPGGGDLMSGSVLAGAMSGATVFQSSGAFVSTGWAQASGVYQASGDFQVNNWAQASGVFMSSGADVGKWQNSGNYMATGWAQASGLYFQSGDTLYSPNLVLETNANLQYAGGNLSLVNAAGGYTLIEGDTYIGFNVNAAAKEMISYSGVHTYNDQVAVPKERHWVISDTTPNGTPATLVTIPMQNNSAQSVEIDCVGVKAGGAERSHYKLTALFQRNGGGAVNQEGSTVSISTIESAGVSGVWDCVFGLSGNDIVINVTGGAYNVYWTISITTLEVAV